MTRRRGEADRLGAARLAGPGQHHVAAVADHVDEARLGQGTLDAAHLRRVARRLVSPARLVLLRRVQVEEGANRRTGVQWLDAPQPLQELILVEPEVRPAAIARDHLGDSIRRGALAARPDYAGNEVGLGRDRELRMRVEHQAQQRGAGARNSDDERGRRPV